MEFRHKQLKGLREATKEEAAECDLLRQRMVNAARDAVMPIVADALHRNVNASVILQAVVVSLLDIANDTTSGYLDFKYANTLSAIFNKCIQDVAELYTTEAIRNDCG